MSDALIRNYRYRLYPTRNQVEALEEQLGFACDLWNAALEQRVTAHRRGARIGPKEQQHELTEARLEGTNSLNGPSTRRQTVARTLNLTDKEADRLAFWVWAVIGTDDDAGPELVSVLRKLDPARAATDYADVVAKPESQPDHQDPAYVRRGDRER